jgi:hypothetical protein
VIEAKAIIVAVVALLLLGGGFYLGYRWDQSKYLNLEAANAKSLALAYQAQMTAYQAKEAAYEKEINELQTTTLTEFPTVPVRLCPSPRLPSSAKAGPVVPPPGGMGTANAQPVPQSAGPDYGPILFGLADKFDQTVAKCREL